jgi:hypothetical protein
MTLRPASVEADKRAIVTELARFGTRQICRICNSPGRPESLNLSLTVPRCTRSDAIRKTEDSHMRKSLIFLQGALLSLAVVGFFVGSSQFGAALI